MIKIHHKFIKLTIILLPSLQRSMAIFFLGFFLIIVEYLKELNLISLKFHHHFLLYFYYLEFKLLYWR